MKDIVIQLPLRNMINEWLYKEYGVRIQWKALSAERVYARDVVEVVFDDDTVYGPYSSIKDLIEECGADRHE